MNNIKNYIKKYNTIAVVSILMISFMVLFVPNTAKAGLLDFTDALTVGTDINIYIRATEDSGVLRELQPGCRVGVYTEDLPGWYRIIYGNYRGYMKADNLFMPGKDETYGIITSDASLKTKPSNGSNSIQTLKTGIPIKITNMIGDWYKVETEPSGEVITKGYLKKQNIMQTDSTEFEMMLTRGMSGDSVIDLHKKLFERGFYGYINYYKDIEDKDNDGNKNEVFKFIDEYNAETEISVKCFQYKAGLKITGIADAETLEKLYSDEDIHSIAQDRGVPDSVRNSRWWECVIFEFPRGATAKIYDLGTRQTYNVQRYSGRNHADVEALTPEDTKILKSTNGGKWSWDRHPVWVITGGAAYAASMNCMPHSPSNSGIKNNGMNGQVCCHFKDSYNHNKNKEDPEHAGNVKDAYFSSINYYEMLSAQRRQNG